MGQEAGRGRRGPQVEEWSDTRRRLAAEMVALGTDPAKAEAEAARKVELARKRLEWGRERLAAFLDMQERAGEAYERLIDANPGVDWESDDAPDLPEPPEAAIAQHIHAELMAAIEEDRWPRHLHSPQV